VPQLEAWTFASQIFWLIVLFSALYYLLSRRALPRITEVLEARQDRIAADLDQAQRLRIEAEQALKTYEARVARAREDAQGLLSEIQARLQAEAAGRQAELDRQLTEQLQAAERRIAEARQAALRELEEAAVSAAQAAAERLAGLKVTKRAAQAALRQVLGEAA
jgi:F-type H+-transporting ATPase subunit b